MKSFQHWSFSFFIALFSLMGSAQIMAHTELKSSEPADGAKLQESPTELALNFAGNVTLLKLDLRSAEGEVVPLEFKPSAKAEKQYRVQLPKLAPAAYTLTWTALGGDGHKLEKSFSFAVGLHDLPASDHDAHHH